MPEIKLPEVRLPAGLREMRREDVQQAVAEARLPRVELPKTIELPKTVELPKNIRLPELDLSKIELPDAIEARLPTRRRRNPFVPVLLAMAGAAAALWVVTASPLAPRIRRAIDDLRSRLGGGSTGADDDLELGIASVGIATYDTSATNGSREPVAVGPGEGSESSIDPVGADVAYGESTYATGTPGELPPAPGEATSETGV